MRVTFIRHGESESNITGRWQGQGDSKLSASGRAQAETLALRVDGEKIDLLVSSDLSRASDTARILGDRVGAAVALDPAFREVDVGRWEGLTRAEVAEQFSDETAALASGARDVKIGGGESWRDLEARVDAAFDSLLRRARGAAHVAVVAHGGVITTLFAGLLGIRETHPRRLGRVGNTSLSTVSVEDESARAVLERWNDTSHLDPLGEWAAERLLRGDAVVSLFAHDARDLGGPVPAGGRLRAVPSVLAVERLASAYRGLARLYASPDAHLRNAAAILAERSDAEVDDEPVHPAAIHDAVSSLAERHRGARVGVVAPHQAIRDLAQRALPLSPKGRAGIAAPAHATVTHVVLGKHGLTLADYAVRVGA